MTLDAARNPQAQQRRPSIVQYPTRSDALARPHSFLRIDHWYYLIARSHRGSFLKESSGSAAGAAARAVASLSFRCREWPNFVIMNPPTAQAQSVARCTRAREQDERSADEAKSLRQQAV
jgi:hypothetical protein